MLAAVEYCVFVDGKHLYGSPNCSHNKSEDEMGLIPDTGWTVQQAPVAGSYNQAEQIIRTEG